MQNKYRIDWSRKSHNYTEEEITAVSNFMRSADTFTQGNKLSEFEKAFEEYIGGGKAFALANGTAAIEIAAALMDLKEGDEIIIPAHTWCSTAIPFIRYGAKIVWADICPITRVINLESIDRVRTTKTKAIVVVHLYGLMADMPKIMSYAQNHNIIVLEDCAQSLGADINKEKAGTFGDCSIFSFHTQKNITTLGEGGALVVRGRLNEKRAPGLIHNSVEKFNNQKEYWIPAMSNVALDEGGVIPFNFCLTEVQAMIGSMLLKRVDVLNDDRINRAYQFIAEMKNLDQLTFQVFPADYRHVYHLMSAKFIAKRKGVTRDNLIRLLAERYKIKCIVQYYPLYRYPLFKALGFGDANCPESDHFFDNMISFPFYHWMPESEFEYLIESVKLAIQTLEAGDQ